MNMSYRSLKLFLFPVSPSIIIILSALSAYTTPGHSPKSILLLGPNVGSYTIFQSSVSSWYTSGLRIPGRPAPSTESVPPIFRINRSLKLHRECLAERWLSELMM